MGAVGIFDALLRYMQRNVSEHEFVVMAPPIHLAMANLAELAARLYALFPEIAPKELGSNPRLLR